MCTQCALPSYHNGGFVATDALGHMLPKSVSCHRINAVISKSAHCFHDS